MRENQYKEVYEELQLLTNNMIDEYKLYLIRDKHNGNYRTAKKMNIYETTDSSQDETLNEVKILKDLKNPHVIKYYDVFIQNEQFITILEFCEEGDLQHYLKRRKDRK